MANKPFALYITCYCGISRLLSDTVKGEDGEIVTLDPCPRCGAGFTGIYRDGRIEVG